MDLNNGTVKWQSPSNIALVKYWGKRGKQLPQNPSVSFTLSNCRTETAVTYEPSSAFGLDFRFDGKEVPEFQTKIQDFLTAHLDSFPSLNRLHLQIDSHNTFPHSSGIASSASSMSALVMCLLDIERMAREEQDIDMKQASSLSRLASGSVSPPAVPAVPCFPRWLCGAAPTP